MGWAGFMFPRRPIGGCGERILTAGRHPQPAEGIEGQVHRLVDVGFRRDELDLETFRDPQGLQLIRRRRRFRGTHHRRERVFLFSPEGGARREKQQGGQGGTERELDHEATK